MSNSAQKNIDIPGKLWLNMILNDEGYQEILIKSLTLVVGSEVSQIEKLRSVKAIKSTLVMNEYSNENSKRDVKKIADEVFPMLSEARKVETIRVLDAVPAVPLDKAAERYKRRVAGLDNVKLTEIYHLEPNKNQKNYKSEYSFTLVKPGFLRVVSQHKEAIVWEVIVNTIMMIAEQAGLSLPKKLEGTWRGTFISATLAKQISSLIVEKFDKTELNSAEAGDAGTFLEMFGEGWLQIR